MEHRTVILLDCHPEAQTLCVKGHDEACEHPKASYIKKFYIAIY